MLRRVDMDDHDAPTFPYQAKSNMILLVDNYDSFVHNLARYFERLGRTPVVVRNDAVDLDALAAAPPEAIVVSPGPCAPAQAGCSVELIRRFAPTTPILGVCLGHQAIGEAFGGKVIRGPRPVHGRASPVFHGAEAFSRFAPSAAASPASPLFAGLPNPFAAGRYHSLVVDEATLPACLEPLAWSDDGVLMALRHRTYPTFGVQFHPESILTQGGFLLLANFLRLAGVEPLAIPPADAEGPPVRILRPLPERPVTF